MAKAVTKTNDELSTDELARSVNASEFLMRVYTSSFALETANVSMREAFRSIPGGVLDKARDVITFPYDDNSPKLLAAQNEFKAACVVFSAAYIAARKGLKGKTAMSQAYAIMQQARPDAVSDGRVKRSVEDEKKVVAARKALSDFLFSAGVESPTIEARAKRLKANAALAITAQAQVQLDAAQAQADKARAEQDAAQKTAEMLAAKAEQAKAADKAKALKAAHDAEAKALVKAEAARAEQAKVEAAKVAAAAVGVKLAGAPAKGGQVGNDNASTREEPTVSNVVQFPCAKLSQSQIAEAVQSMGIKLAACFHVNGAALSPDDSEGAVLIRLFAQVREAVKDLTAIHDAKQAAQIKADNAKKGAKGATA